MVRISEEYQEVEYVESSSDGDPFILTDILMPKEIVCYHTFTLLQYKDQYGWGAIGNGFSGAGFGQYGHRLQYNYSGSYKYVGNPAISIGKKYSTKLILLDGRQELYVDGVQGQSWNKANTRDGENIRIALFRANGSGLRGAMRMYYIKFTNADESIVLGEFIPCYRKSDDEIGMYDTVSKQFYTNSGTGTFLKGHNIYYDDVNLLEQRRKILLNTPHLETIQNNIATFNTDMNVSLKDCKIYFSPMQEGEGDPSPENVRPIRGWDGINVYIGRNILDGMTLNYKNSNIIYPYNYGSVTVYSKIGSACTDWINCSQYRGQTLTLNHAPEPGGAGWCFYSATNTSDYVTGFYSKDDSSVVEGGLWTITVPDGDNINYMRFSTHPDYLNDVQILLNMKTTTISFPQTIYGGYVDLIKGEIVDQWSHIFIDQNSPIGIFPWRGIKIDDKTGIQYTSALFKRAQENPRAILNCVPYCDKLPGGLSRNLNTCYMYDGDVYGACINLPTNLIGTTKNELKTYLTNNNFDFVYQLKVPIIHSINPQTLKTLKGTNNIFSNANGNIQVKFWKH